MFLTEFLVLVKKETLNDEDKCTSKWRINTAHNSTNMKIHILRTKALVLQALLCLNLTYTVQLEETNIYADI